MKSVKSFSIIALIGTAAFTNISFAQDQIKIKIDANVNGESIQIDTTVDYMSDFDLNRFLGDLGLNDEIGELHINIQDDPFAPSEDAFYFEFDDSAMQNMMLEMQKMQIPPIPEVPPMPGTANMMFFNGNKSFLGVVTEKTKGGVVITEVVENSAAKAAGLKEGDVITKINEMTVESTNNLVEIIGEFDPGSAITVTYIRDGKTQTANATLKENENYFESNEWEEYGKQWEEWGKEFEMQWKDFGMEAGEERAFLGVYLGEPENGGVLIEGTEEGSAAEEAGLKEGDIITKLDGKAIATYEDIVKIIQAKNPGDPIEVTYKRDNKENKVKATLKGKKSEMFMWKGEDSAMNYNAMPPGAPCNIHTYAYCLGDGAGKNVKMQVHVISKDEVEQDAKTAMENAPEILDPATIQFFPNPNNGTFTLKFNLKENGDTRITIKDIQGATVYDEELKGFEGSYEKVITLGNNAKGNYLINITQNGFSATKQIVVQ